ncbi:2-oxo acid dehydrogenase subunit E2 [Candidatus Poribacteria bacterium]|nr:2-oxo acid dehydrogenase subunit E2 [Candidatus Poribacteria bacterium]
MAAEVVMPKLSDTMEEGRIIKWLKKVGDSVREGEPLLDVETDKADIEVEAFDTGILLEITVEEGETIKVGEKIGLIGAPEEAEKVEKPAAEEKKLVGARFIAPDSKERIEKPPLEEKRPEATGEPEKREKLETKAEPREERGEIGRKPKEVEEARKADREKEAQPRREPEVSIHMEKQEAIEKFVARRSPGKVAASPLAKELAQGHGIDLTAVTGTGPHGEIVRRDVEKIVSEREAARKPEAKAARPERTPELKATPLAVVLAEKEGVDLDEIKGTGIGGRIREIDVKAYVARRCELRGEEFHELSLMRKTIARRMTESKQNIPHFYLVMPIYMGAALRFRKQLNEGKDENQKISVNDIIVKAAAIALERTPEVNSTFSDDKIKINKSINVGVATATPDGLVVPVILDANKKSVGEIAIEARDKIERAKKRKLKPDEYSNATFTVSNLGMFGIEQFSAIIDPGQSAILAVGAVANEPVVLDGRIETRQMMRVTLSCDHRAIDGYIGAQYLVKLKLILEKPERIIL